MTPYVSLWLRAFLMTQVVEVSVGWLLLWLISRVRRDAVSFSPVFITFALLMASALTHPPLWFVLVRLRRVGLSYEQYVVVGELFVWVCEALWYVFVLAPLRGRLFWALWFSLVLNGVSYWVGRCL